MQLGARAFGLTILLTLALASCNAARANSAVAEVCPTAPEAHYFPVGSFNPRTDEFVRRWYSSDLAAMDEPSLSCGLSPVSESYRFLWLRSFHNPVAVRVDRTGEGYRLEAVILDGAGGYAPGHVSRRIAKDLSRAEWRNLTAEIDRIHFWQMPSTTNLMGNDGASWVVEARRDGRYHFVDRWGGADNIQSVGLLLLRLADLGDVRPVY